MTESTGQVMLEKKDRPSRRISETLAVSGKAWRLSLRHILSGNKAVVEEKDPLTPEQRRKYDYFFLEALRRCV